MILISHPGSDLRHISLITNFIMEGGSCHCVQWAVWIYTLCLPQLPFQQQQQLHCPLSVETSVILWHFMRPFEPSRYWTDFHVSALHPGSSIRTWKDVKESMWMNKWCRPSVKDGTGKRRLFKNASFPSASAPLRSVLRKYCSIPINKIK